ncbi:hypothetical protein MTO96_047461 [Rhipicephalus appendiculatus]
MGIAGDALVIGRRRLPARRSGPMAGLPAQSLPYMAIWFCDLNGANARAIKRPPAAFRHRSRVRGFAWEPPYEKFSHSS